jgi:AcrR family transcriptional regulator
MATASPSRRDHLVDTALHLFCKQGIRATGIDAVLAESGVAKKTLYNHFRSKDELIIAALGRRDEQFFGGIREKLARLTAAQDGDPRLAPVLAYFEALREWIESDDFNGCTFINASAEYPRRDDPVHVACANHKKQVTQFLESLLVDVPLQDKQEAALQLALLSDGAIVQAHTAGDTGGVLHAKKAAARLLEAFL